MHSNVPQQPVQNGVVLPKTSNVARSNSLRSSSPPRIRRDLRNQANVPPSVPEESPPVPPAPQQYTSLRREHSNYTLNKPIAESPVEWTQHQHDAVRNVPEINDNQHTPMTYQNIQNANVPYQHNHPPQPMTHAVPHGLNGNSVNMGMLLFHSLFYYFLLSLVLKLQKRLFRVVCTKIIILYIV